MNYHVYKIIKNPSSNTHITAYPWYESVHTHRAHDVVATVNQRHFQRRNNAATTSCAQCNIDCRVLRHVQSTRTTWLKVVNMYMYPPKVTTAFWSGCGRWNHQHQPRLHFSLAHSNKKLALCSCTHHYFLAICRSYIIYHNWEYYDKHTREYGLIFPADSTVTDKPFNP